MDIEFLIATRNDGYCGDPMARLRTSLRHNLMASPQSWRFTVVDWGSRTKVSSALPTTLYGDRVRILYVPEDVTSRFPTPFSEVHALNYGARRAEAPLVARIDQDTMFGDRFAAWARAAAFHPYLAYFSGRRDLPEGADKIENGAPHNADPCRPDYTTAAVGALIVPRQAWADSRGYDEQNLWHNHMEREFVRRLERHLQFVNLGLITDMDFYHLWHEKPAKRENREMSPEECRARPFVVNGEDWGLGGLK